MNKFCYHSNIKNIIEFYFYRFTAGTLLNDTIFLYNNTHRLINIKYPSYHCKNLGSPIKN